MPYEGVEKLAKSLMLFVFLLHLAFFTFVFFDIPTYIYDATCFLFGELPDRLLRRINDRGFFVVCHELSDFILNPSRLVRPYFEDVWTNITWAADQLGGYFHVASVWMAFIVCTIFVLGLTLVQTIVRLYSFFSTVISRTVLWICVAAPSFLLACLVFVPTYMFGACDEILKGLYDELEPRRRRRRRRRPRFVEPEFLVVPEFRVAPPLLERGTWRRWLNQMEEFWRARLPEFPPEQLEQIPEQPARQPPRQEDGVLEQPEGAGLEQPERVVEEVVEQLVQVVEGRLEQPERQPEQPGGDGEQPERVVEEVVEELVRVVEGRLEQPVRQPEQPGGDGEQPERVVEEVVEQLVRVVEGRLEQTEQPGGEQPEQEEFSPSGYQRSDSSSSIQDEHGTSPSSNNSVTEQPGQLEQSPSEAVEQSPRVFRIRTSQGSPQVRVEFLEPNVEVDGERN